MIQDSLNNAERYYALHPRFREAFEFLKNRAADPAFAGGELRGKEVYATVFDGNGRGRAGARLEAHRSYIDIQYVVAGRETMGFSPTARCAEPAADYDREKDIVFFNDAPEEWLELRPGDFVVLYPEDAHAPLSAEGPLRKIVVKVLCGPEKR